MSKPAIIGIVAVAVAVLAGGSYLALHKSSTKTDMNNMNTSTSTTKKVETPAASTNSVTIENFAFSPADITVKKGTTVTWTNKDSTPHTVTETDGQTGPNSDTLDNGKTYSFTFDTVGTFKYHCSIHSSMVGSVTVTE